VTTIQTLTEHFRTEQRNIGLGARRKVAIAAHLEVRAALKLAQPLVERGLADVLIGSYPRRTGIWPGRDVDVFGKLTNESIDTIEPSEAYDLFFTVLDRSFPGRVQPQDRSVKVEYRPSTLPAVAFIREAARLLEQPETIAEALARRSCDSWWRHRSGLPGRSPQCSCMRPLPLPPLDVLATPEPNAAGAEIDDRLGKVRVPAEVSRDTARVRETQDGRDLGRTDQVIRIDRLAHLPQSRKFDSNQCHRLHAPT